MKRCPEITERDTVSHFNLVVVFMLGDLLNDHLHLNDHDLLKPRSQPKIWRKIQKIGGDISPASPAFWMYDLNLGRCGTKPIAPGLIKVL